MANPSKQAGGNGVTLNVQDVLIGECAEKEVKKYIKVPYEVKINEIEIKERDAYGRVLVLLTAVSENGRGEILSLTYCLILQGVFEGGTYIAKPGMSARPLGNMLDRDKIIDILKKTNNWGEPV